MERRYYIGIDFGEKSAIVSYFFDGMREPETISTIAGSERFQIPLPEDVTTKEGFADFLKKLVLLSSRLGNPTLPDKLILCIDKLTAGNVELFHYGAERLGLSGDKLLFIDRKESFYYYAYSQKRELWLYDVCIYEYSGEEMICLLAQKKNGTTPQMITITEQRYPMKTADRDQAFTDILSETLQGHICSTAYLTGDGFDGNWMKDSISMLCRGRRAFIGKNLYSKGACYAAIAQEAEAWPFVYIGENEMKLNVSLKVRDKTGNSFFSLISAGENWYDAKRECEVILDDEKTIAFWLQHPQSREAKIERLRLEDLPERPDRMTRLRIQASAVSDREVNVKIRDLGFGGLMKSSEKTWEYTMKL